VARPQDHTGLGFTAALPVHQADTRCRVFEVTAPTRDMSDEPPLYWSHFRSAEARHDPHNFIKSPTHGEPEAPLVCTPTSRGRRAASPGTGDTGISGFATFCHSLGWNSEELVWRLACPRSSERESIRFRVRERTNSKFQPVQQVTQLGRSSHTNCIYHMIKLS